VVTLVLEGDARPGGEVGDRARHEDLARARDRRDTRNDSISPTNWSRSNLACSPSLSTNRASVMWSVA
jgi:hypothetical protein